MGIGNRCWQKCPLRPSSWVLTSHLPLPLVGLIALYTFPLHFLLHQRLELLAEVLWMFYRNKAGLAT